MPRITSEFSGFACLTTLSLTLIVNASLEARAFADDPLAVGEVLVANANGFVHRVDPNPPYTSQTITTKGDLSVAAATSTTVYTLDSDGGSGTLSLYSVDVTTNQDTLLAQFQGSMGDIAIEPSGTVLVLVAESMTSGRLMRVDPSQDPVTTEEVIAHGALGTHYGWGAVLKVSGNGDIFVRGMDGRAYRLDNGSLTEVWTNELFGLPFDIDRATGDLIVHDGPGLKRASPSAAYAPTLVFGGTGSVAGLGSFTHRIAVDADGTVLFSDIQDNVYRADPANPSAAPVNIYAHEDVVEDIEVFLPRCMNGLDDNGDGQVDFLGGDPTCESPQDLFECSVSFPSSGPAPNGVALLLLAALVWRRRATNAH